MNSNALFRHWRAADKKADLLYKASLKDAQLAPLAKHARTLADGLFELFQERKRAEAVKADKGEILYTMFMPLKYGGMKEIVRTPHRIITRLYYGQKDKPYEHTATPFYNKPYEELAKLWKEAA